MTIASTSPSIEYIGVGAATPLSVPFRFFANADLIVTSTVSGITTTLVSGTDYTVTGANNPAGGTVTPTDIIAIGTIWKIVRITARTQLTDFVDGNDFPAEAHENGLDRLMAIQQEQDVQIDDVQSRAYLVPPGDGGGTFPADRADQIVGFDALKQLKLYSYAALAALLAPPLTPLLAFIQKGDAGPANNSHYTLTELKAADVTNATAIYDENTWKIADAADYSAAIAADPTETYFAVSTEDASKVWVRNDRKSLLVDLFYRDADGDDNAPSFNRALVLGNALHRHIRAMPGGSYRFILSVDIKPDANGWTPGIDLKNSTIKLNKEIPDIAGEGGGFRYRGVKSGEAVNVTAGYIRNGTIDAQSQAISNGCHGIFGENASNVRISNVDGINYTMGSHIQNFAYLEGGNCSGFITEDCAVSGAILADSSGIKWYGGLYSADLSVGKPGDAVPDGSTVVLATIQTAAVSNNRPRFATPYYWTNSSGGPVILPAAASFTVADLTAAGLTQGGTTKVVNGAVTASIVAEYYESGGFRIAGPISRIRDSKFIRSSCRGGYYGFYFQGTLRCSATQIETFETIRGIVGEWNNNRIRIRNSDISETYSSAILLGYGNYNFEVSNIDVDQEIGRWVGEALFNIQLSAVNGNLRGLTTRTATNVLSGQHHLRISMNSNNISVDDAAFRGDCAKGYVVLESAWNSTISGANPEHYPQSIVYNGGALTPMTDIQLSNIRVKAESIKTTVPVAFSLMQVDDAINGAIGLSDVKLTNCKALSAKHVQNLKVFEATSGQAKDMTLENIQLDPTISVANAPTRVPLPRGHNHFKSIRNVTLLDDDKFRDLPASAGLPDVTYGKHWYLHNNGSTITGLTGGKPGREIFLYAGNVARTVNNSVATDGTAISMPGSAAEVMSAREALHLVYGENVTNLGARWVASHMGN